MCYIVHAVNINDLRPDYKLLFIALLSLILSSLVFLGFWLYRKCHSDTIFDQRTPAALERIADAMEANKRDCLANENALNDVNPHKPWKKISATIPCEMLVGGCP